MNFSLILRRELWKRNVWTTLLHTFKPTWSKLILIQTVLPGQKALAHIQLMCCVGQHAITFLKFSYGATFLVLKNQAFLHILNTFCQYGCEMAHNYIQSSPAFPDTKI